MKLLLPVVLLAVLAPFFVQAGEVVPASRPVAGDDLAVESTFPEARTVSAPLGSAIRIEFDRPLDPATVSADSVAAFGKWSGPVLGALALGNDNRTLTLTPDEPFFAGEIVIVSLSDAITAQDGSTLPAGGFAFQFWTRTALGSLDFTVIDILSTRTDPNVQVQSYGGFATDLNNDGWADLTVVNEISADMRIFLNRADGSGLYEPFLTPPEPVGPRASPSDPADFNGDGEVDAAVVNISGDSVSILLGNGDGTFAPQQNIAVGSAPRGIAVLDVEGDGDMDVVNTNYGSSNLSLLLNDGTGTFGAPIFFEGGGDAEWALGTADMDEDGRLDLVVGSQGSRTISTLHNNGDGTFSVMDVQDGDRAWMIMLGDLNGDGHEDVSVANGNDNNGGILFGDGQGNLSPPTTYPTDNLTLATDLGDIDGDGDLDWITSSFFGDWRLFLNDGAGNFTYLREFDAVAAGSCALLVDIDNDGDLDLALTDEIVDTVQLVRQDGVPPSIVPASYLPVISR